MPKEPNFHTDFSVAKETLLKNEISVQVFQKSTFWKATVGNSLKYFSAGSSILCLNWMILKSSLALASSSWHSFSVFDSMFVNKGHLKSGITSSLSYDFKHKDRK
jgi:hypothetical protein